MGEPDNKTVRIQDEVIEMPEDRKGEGDDVHAEVCIQPGHHREDSGFSNGEEDDAQHRLSELEDKLYRRCFDKVTFSTTTNSFSWIIFFIQKHNRIIDILNQTEFSLTRSTTSVGMTKT